MASVEEAEQIVWDLTARYGYLNKEMMDDIERFNSQYRRNIDENFLRMETKVSHSIKILAKQIYGSGARFVFELLQNAEDNKFEKAIKRDALPYISFKIHPNHIVVDCNEDGFTKPDLQAICDVGESTKSATHGYIGAKGIGFKSVFIAACRVHIQSGNFSFEFQHNKTDPGIGMIRPLWVNPVETIPNPLTRMTLYLHDQGDEAEIQHLRRIISMQFDDLQETCLLFLQKLQRISLEFYDENGNLERSKQFRKHEMDEHRVSLETTLMTNGEETTQTQIYHITKKTATGLAHSDNRELPDTAEGRRTSSMAEIVLAFPLTSDSKPLITRKKQDLFAFLPLRKSDYKFLIHSDFDTNANRQDIVTTSRRNLDLRSWIAEAFFLAVLQFCEHPTLCYHWPMFLPSADNGSDAFWSGLDDDIQTMMKKRPILKSRNRNSLRLIHDIFILVTDAKDGDGQPLFDDPVKDPFLSPKYPQSAVNILREYGLRILHVDMLIDLLQTDLLSPSSKMHGKHTTNEWHSAVARLFSPWFERNTVIRYHALLRSLPLLPLRDGQWTSVASGPVYIPATGDINIPDGLDLKVIDPSASKNPKRNTFFRHLGVSEATIDQVRASILRSFCSNLSLSVEIVKTYLDYLYLTHVPGTHMRKVYAKVQVLTNGGRLMSPSQKDIYLPGTNHTYSPASLLTAHGTAPGFPTDFLHPKYMDHVPAGSGLHPTWKKWLCDFVGIRERLRLLSRKGDALSEAFLYVFEHRSDNFLGLFEHLWLHEKSNLLGNKTLRSEIENLPAKHLCGVDYPIKLKQTWLPFKHLRDSVGLYMEFPEQFPFLKVEEADMTQQFGAKWNFLNTSFSVGKDDDVAFLLETLRCIERSCPKPSSIRQTQMVFRLYIAIYAKLAVASDKPASRRSIKKFFNENGILDLDEKEPAWVSTGGYPCLWVAPPDMITASSLKAFYSKRLGDEDMGMIENLFRGTLEIPDASLHDLLRELELLRQRGYKDTNRMRTLYKYLDESTTPTSDMRAAFEASPLIYYETPRGGSGWCKTSDCLWSSKTVIRGKVTLDECWEGQKSFFVDKLGVKLLTLQMVYDELRQSPQSGPDEIKVAIMSLNGFLQTKPAYLDPEPIRKAKIFPVRYPNGTVVSSSVDVDFAIGDRDKLKAKFQDKISLLDFDLEDVHRLKPFFKWASLQDRYLSNSVKELTSISGESGRPISSRNRDLKRKAYYIARVAATFNSPRFECDPNGLYEQLRTMAVMEIDGISSMLEMSQNEKKFKVEVATANEHIDDISGRLTIYVPEERRAQEMCFGSVLPRKLAAWLMRHPTSHIEETVEIDAVNALTAIFACDRYVLDEVLDDQGILQVSFENKDGEDEGEGEDEDEDEDGGEEEEEEEQEQQQSGNLFETDDTSLEQQITPTHSSVNDTSSLYAGSYNTESQDGLTETVVETISRQSHLSYQPPPGTGVNSSQPALLRQPSRSPNTSSYQAPQHLPPSPATPLEIRSSEDVQYLAILNGVIEKARRAAFPSLAFNMSDLRDALLADTGNADSYDSFDGLDVMSRFRSTSQLERDKKIGAAGELYVFELLSQLEMPGWSRANWQSRIRWYAKIHPDYTDMAAWTTAETADFIYADTTGQFTNTLVDCRYLDRGKWEGQRPKYYIEVKTTTGPCHTPFYMSGKQYKLMKRIHTEHPREIYIIFRVFWLNSERLGLCIYVDPEQLKRDRKLEFMGRPWAVTPGDGTEVDD